MSSDPQQVDSITVVGGGDSGLLTALALEKGLDDPEIVVVDDFEESVPEVGKSTLSYVVTFLRDLLEIDLSRLVENVKLAWKATVYFEDWCGVEPFHSPLGQPLPIVDETEGISDSRIQTLSPDHEAEFHEWYYRYQQRNFSTLYTEVAERPGKAPIVMDEEDVFNLKKPLPSVSYHFNSRSLNKYLRELCHKRDIELINDRITDVLTSENQIDRIESDTAEYSSDLYVDASGFRRLLMRELDNNFIEFDLPVDSAVVTTIDIPFSDVTSATVIMSGDAGWFWQIDTAGHMTGARDLGYVYSSAHRSDEAAKQEFIETRDEDIDPNETRLYRFDSGVLEQPWLNNCVATGNALGFVEPLQSTALTTTCRLAARLVRLLGKHARVNHDGLRKVYNKTSRNTWEEVYNFVSIYYKYNSGSTEFWEDARSINPGKLPQYESYQDVGFSAWKDIYRLTRTGTDLNEYYLYYLVYRSLGVESEFYKDFDFKVDPEVIDLIDEYTADLSEQVDTYLNYEEIFHVYHPGYE
ncbi:MAG: tryptophan 7-halogenase [Halobacteriales archaeon]